MMNLLRAGTPAYVLGAMVIVSLLAVGALEASKPFRNLIGAFQTVAAITNAAKK